MRSPRLHRLPLGSLVFSTCQRHASRWVCSHLIPSVPRISSGFTIHHNPGQDKSMLYLQYYQCSFIEESILKIDIYIFFYILILHMIGVHSGETLEAGQLVSMQCVSMCLLVEGYDVVCTSSQLIIKVVLFCCIALGESWFCQIKDCTQSSEYAGG